MPRVAACIRLSDDELTELQMTARSVSGEYRLVQRARVILAWHEGHTIPETVALTGLSREGCRRWRRRFEQERLAGLRDQRRPGRPQTLSAETKALVVQAACTGPVQGQGRLSQRRIAKQLNVSQTTVSKALRSMDLRPHKTDYWCGKPTDPEFGQKMTAIVALYMNPPENALVLCVDEKTQIQALDRTQPVLPMRAGDARKLTNTYTRHGTVSLIAALSVHTGAVDAKTMERNTASNFLTFLKRLYRTHPGKHLHIVVDNHSAHTAAEVKDWVQRRRRLTLHFTPTYSSWLNQVETWLSILTRDVLRDAVWRSKEQLVSELMAYVRAYSKDRAKPFAWTYTGQPCSVQRHGT
jgi:transposase